MGDGLKRARAAATATRAKPKLEVWWFTASWCGPCRGMKRAWASFTEAHETGMVALSKATRIKTKVIDIDEHPDLMKEHKIMSIPTLLFVRGDKVVVRHEGALTRGQLEDALTEAEKA